jgi:CRP-like cAMP-binding protein
MKFSKGQFLYRRGDLADSLYIIRAGKIGLFSNGEDESTAMTTLGPSQIIGDLAFFTEALRTSDAKALTDVECTKVPYSAVRQQFESVPPWVQIMTRTLANQVRFYSNELKTLKNDDDGSIISRLTLARAWSALTFVTFQFGSEYKDTRSIDWATLRTYANFAFREVSNHVLQVARILQSLGHCEILDDKSGPTDLVFKHPALLTAFLKYYTRAIVKDSPELTKIDPVVHATLNLLAHPKLQVTPIHRGLVEIDLVEFNKMAVSLGQSSIAATSVDLLVAYGIEIEKIAADGCVKLRFHQEEVKNLAQFWSLLRIVQNLNRPTSNADVAV